MATNIGCQNCQAVWQLLLQILFDSSVIPPPDARWSNDSWCHECQQQKGGSDCGLFAITFATFLVFGQCPTHCQYMQKQLQCHLVQCLENKEMISFPSRKVNLKYLSEIRNSYSLLDICTCRCQMWYHIDCINLPPDSPCLNDSFAWFCASCK